jgi:hypothetical protein
MNFTAPVLVHKAVLPSAVSGKGRTKKTAQKATIVGAVWTSTRGQILVTEKYSVKVCHRDHGNTLRSWSFRPDRTNAFVGKGAITVNEGRVRWIVAQRAGGKIVSWREDDESAKLHHDKFLNAFDVPEDTAGDPEALTVQVTKNRVVKVAENDGSVRLCGWDTVFNIELDSVSLEVSESNASNSKTNRSKRSHTGSNILNAIVSGDRKTVLVVLGSAVYAVGVRTDVSRQVHVVGRGIPNPTQCGADGREVVVNPLYSSIKPGIPSHTLWNIRSGEATRENRNEIYHMKQLTDEEDREEFSKKLVACIGTVDGSGTKAGNHQFQMSTYFCTTMVGECLEREAWGGLKKLLETRRVSACVVPQLIPRLLQILKSKKETSEGTVAPGKRSKRRRATNAGSRKKQKMSGATAANSDVTVGDFSLQNVLELVLAQVSDIPETSLVEILQYGIRYLDHEAFVPVMNRLLLAPFNAKFMSTCLGRLSNPEVRVILLYLRKTFKHVLKGEEFVVRDHKSSDNILPRVIAWFSMVLDTHFGGVIMRSATADSDLHQLIASVHETVIGVVHSAKSVEKMQVQLKHFEQLCKGEALPAGDFPEYCVEHILV